MLHFAALAAAILPSLASASPRIGLQQTNSTAGRGVSYPSQTAVASEENVAPKLTIFQCDALARAGLSDQLYLQNSTEYKDTLHTYYDGSIQALTPRCVLKPTSTQHVADALKALSEEAGNCWTVGIRSGGHSVAPNNNAQNGVTIDLGLLNSVTYTENAGSEVNQSLFSA